ncbi:MAG: hypothetical protein WDO17_23685 [Alphaproteobacteria bacterium]
MPARQTPVAKAAETAITVRPSNGLLKRIDDWIDSQDKAVSRSAAILQLAERGLESAAMSSQGGGSGRGAKQAAGMASDAIDHLGESVGNARGPRAAKETACERAF